MQRRASDVRPARLLNTLQCPPTCVNKDDEISLISEQEQATSVCVAPPTIYAPQFPR